MGQPRWKKEEIHEALVVLYLRLNGYFTTSLVVHAPEWGRNRTEIDCLAVRHPNHAQPDRMVEPSQFLEPLDSCVDLLICEVKSNPARVAFNQRLLDQGALEHVLQWAGVFPSEEVPRVACGLLRILKQEGLDARRARDGVVAAGVRVRGLLCCPPATEADIPGGWCLLGPEIFEYASKCFNPPAPRASCSTRYNLNLWGRWLAPLVRYFKRTKSPSLDELYKRLGAA